jgi:2-dehydro-3-deoxyphosphogluconate aldolase/(4S)-4-hydroxy-2-oxoglutarate aldolase
VALRHDLPDDALFPAVQNAIAECFQKERFMKALNILEVMRAGPVIPVIVIEHVAQAVPLARALIAGGVHVLEVTLRTPMALAAVRAIVDEVPEAIVGVGTLTRPEDMTEALAAGARFGVSPGLTPLLIEAARGSGLPLLPGVMTPSEVIAARLAGFHQLKLFPAQQAGGTGMLKALAGPFQDVAFCPTGGITAETAREFLALPNVACVGGSWLTPQAALATADWQAITALAKQASALHPC